MCPPNHAQGAIGASFNSTWSDFVNAGLPGDWLVALDALGFLVSWPVYQVRGQPRWCATCALSARQGRPAPHPLHPRAVPPVDPAPSRPSGPPLAPSTPPPTHPRPPLPPRSCSRRSTTRCSTRRRPGAGAGGLPPAHWPRGASCAPPQHMHAHSRDGVHNTLHSPPHVPCWHRWISPPAPPSRSPLASVAPTLPRFQTTP